MAFSWRAGAASGKAPSANTAATAPKAQPSPSASTSQPAFSVRQNDLSGRVPSNQVYAQAYNQASEQVGSPTRATSYTMPGTATSRSYNPMTGQYSAPQSRQSFDGNMAYNAIDDRPGPIQARATGIGGAPMPWQDALSQREAFAGGLVERLSQYQSGAASGRPDINPGQLLTQANERLANGSFINPFRSPIPAATNLQEPVRYDTQPPSTDPYNSDVAMAVRQATPYTQGTQWQNPFGRSANITPPATLEAFLQPEPLALEQYSPNLSQPIQETAAVPQAQPPAARGSRRFPWR